MSAPARSLDGKVVVISGVGPGLGRTLALQCAERGAKLVLGARSAGLLDQLAVEIVEAGGEALAVPTDVADPQACARLIDAAVNRFGGIDGLVNSAFRFEIGRFEGADLASWRDAMNVTCFGALELAQAAVPHLRARGGGSIVNVSTLSTRIPTDGAGGYGIAKAALDMATRQLATELGPYGIRVNATLMGWMDGEPLRQGFAGRAEARGMTVEALMTELTASIPLRRIPTDTECARSVIFFLSDDASPITGALLNVNGGQYMGT
ncbi:SDR family oxidoreductase [Flavisphingomonas formosensis]|uniref:SDR family oxidoreductase n=1 Tax=Flavisphingomonas formosensis TaxID=861534 RepID=UPI001E302CAB|nr:SDR family oxidoreductase [Sphingomonas formosensis]